MSRYLSRTLAATLCLLAMVVAPSARAAAPDSSAAPAAVTLGPGSVLWLEGTSTMHEYESRTEQVEVSLGRDPATADPADVGGLEALIRSAGVRQVDVRVPVRALHSKKAGLDKNLWRALESDPHPMIHCRLTHYTLTPATGGDTLQIRAEGTLEVAGRTRLVTLEARAHRTTAGIWLEGSKPLLMSDYGIKPPTMMLGALRVADRVTVHYRLLLKPAGGETKAQPTVVQDKGAER